MVEMPVRIDEGRNRLGTEVGERLHQLRSDTPMPASTSALPSGPVRTAMFPPEPSSALMLLRSLCVTIGEVAALSLIRLTRPRASAKAWRGLIPFVAAKPPEAMQQRQNARLDKPEECAAFILSSIRADTDASALPGKEWHTAIASGLNQTQESAGFPMISGDGPEDGGFGGSDSIH